MSVTGLGRVLWRRWYITILGLLATVGLVLGAVSLVPVKYEAKSYVLLLPPSAKDGSNPLLSLGGLQSTVDVLARAMLDATTADALKRQGVTATYTVARDLTTDGPVLVVTTDDKTSSGALSANADVVARLAPTMLALQSQQAVKTSSLISLQEINKATTTAVLRKSQIRALLVAVAVGILLTVLLAALIDGLVLRRRSRRTQKGSLPSFESAIDGRGSALDNGRFEPVGAAPSLDSGVGVGRRIPVSREPVSEVGAARGPDPRRKRPRPSRQRKFG